MKTIARKRATDARGNVPPAIGVSELLRIYSTDCLFLVLLVGESCEADFAFASQERRLAQSFADEFNAHGVRRPTGQVAIVLTWRQVEDAFPEALKKSLVLN
jgi:hypothetical protein